MATTPTRATRAVQPKWARRRKKRERTTKPPAAARRPTPPRRRTRTSTNSSSKPMRKPKCLPLKRRMAGSTGRGRRSRRRSGATARPGRAGFYLQRLTSRTLGAAMRFQILGICQSITRGCCTVADLLFSLYSLFGCWVLHVEV